MKICHPIDRIFPGLLINLSLTALAPAASSARSGEAEAPVSTAWLATFRRPSSSEFAPTFHVRRWTSVSRTLVGWETATTVNLVDVAEGMFQATPSSRSDPGEPV
jgi:hypothetical protein